MILVTEDNAATAATLLAQVGKRCEAAVRGPGFGINVCGALALGEDGVFSVTCDDRARLDHATAVFELRHVETLRRSNSGMLLVTLRTEDPRPVTPDP